MAQAIRGYTLSTLQIQELGAAVSGPKPEEGWTYLKEKAQEVRPEFPHAGFVMTVMISYLEEHGVPVPVNDSDPDVRKILHSPLTLLACFGGEQARTFLQRLEHVAPGDAELTDYFREFGEEPPGGGATGLRDALKYLQAGAQAASLPGRRFVVFIA
jgi:hypothetical protein